MDHHQCYVFDLKDPGACLSVVVFAGLSSLQRQLKAGNWQNLKSTPNTAYS